MDIVFAVGVIALLIIGFVVLVISWRAEIAAEAERDDALEALETERRIADATRETPDPPDAREWLRRFGAGGADPDKR